MLKIFLFVTLLFSLVCNNDSLFAQQRKDTAFNKNGSADVRKTNEDTLIVKGTNKADTTGKNLLALDTTGDIKKHNPKVATFRSAVLPGWGQAYNKRYWKIPIIYGALGITAGVFVYNLKTYKLLRKAIVLRSDTIPGNDNQVDDQFLSLSTESIRTYRNAFRQNVDYSVLFFLVFWGLNVVDATVDAHLKAFDVTPDISMKVRPGINYMNTGAGISIVFSFKDRHSKKLSTVP
ncbi:MAG: DUF5683 domain-containing protein [Ginsengibacter sp.]